MSTILSETPGEATRTVTLTVNGTEHRRTVPVRLLLSDFLRHHLGLTGTHVGCEHGVCGCCTVLVDGRAARSCLALAVSLEGATVETVESLATDGELHPIQQAFRARHALQCGFCTPGFLMSVKDFLETTGRADLTDDEIREGISGNLCRCTGYTNIVDAVRLASEMLYGQEA
jgi:aerobic-type carbon monoxide dehydrogenase small subunit (CoxS/CutS family)